MKPRLIIILAFRLLTSSALGQDISAPTNSNQISYALGMQMVAMLKLDDFDIDMKALAAGMTDMQTGKALLTPEEKKIALHEMQEDILAKAVAKKEAAGEINRKEGLNFLAANAGKEGVKVKEIIAPDGSKSELQYKILQSGPAGSSPKMDDSVNVRYQGHLINGTPFDVFDSSIKHGEIATFKMSDAIPGWAAALQMMKPGDKWELYVPPSLAYADYGPPEIGMHTTLIYQLELVSFSKPQATGVAISPVISQTR